MMGRISAVFEITVKKLREPAFLLLFIIALALGACVSEMEALSLKQDSGVLFGLISSEHGHSLLAGFVIIFFMTLIVALFAGATDIPKDIESRGILLILSKPVKRVEYLAGKYLGIAATCAAFFLTASIAAVAVHWIRTGEIFALPVLLRQLLLLAAVFPFAAMTMMISVFLPDISAMILAAAYFIFSLFISALSLFVDMLPKSIEVISVIHFIAYFFPNFFFFFSSFNFSGMVLISLIVYSFSLTVIFLMIAVFRLNRRDMI